MAGRGPAPKDPAKRQRRNKDTHESTTIERVVSDQPELPPYPFAEEGDGDWPPATRKWWDVWATSPQAELFGPTDWDFLIDTALIHARYWTTGDSKYASELRLRVAKYGATPEDRARLRMQYADADAKEQKKAPAQTAAAPPSRYGNVTPLRVVNK